MHVAEKPARIRSAMPTGLIGYTSVGWLGDYTVADCWAGGIIFLHEYIIGWKREQAEIYLVLDNDRGIFRSLKPPEAVPVLRDSFRRRNIIL